MIKVSRSLKELAYKSCACRERLQEAWGREPTITEIASELKVETEELLMAMDASSEIESLQQAYLPERRTGTSADGQTSGAGGTGR